MAAFPLRICDALPESIHHLFARERLTQPGREEWDAYLSGEDQITMSRPKITRKEIATTIVAQTNAIAKEKIEGIEINSLVSNGHTPTWSPGVYWPPATAGGLTEQTLQKVVAELQEKFDISD